MRLAQRICILLLVISFSGATHAASWQKLTHNIDLQCAQINSKLTCEYRKLNEQQPDNLSASYLGKPIQLLNIGFSTDKNNSVDVLFLVDTSDPARQNVIEKNKKHIEAIINNTSEAGLNFALAVFDKTFRIESPFGQSSFLLKKQLANLKASGKTTELYRNVIQALQYLDEQDASRKVLVLLSDGQAEDLAYFHSDVVNLARKTGIVINSIGYPRSVSLSVALQTLRRLSEETGGTFKEVDQSLELENTYIRKALNNIFTGGQFIVSLEDLSNTSNKKAAIKLLIDKNDSLLIPIKLPLAKTTIEPIKNNDQSETATNVEIPTEDIAPVTIITKQVEAKPINLWLWYGVPAAFIIIIILILITLFLVWQRPANKKSKAPVYEYKPYAYLIDNDKKDIRYPVMRTICRIGRGKDNELILDDNSVSRRHAEVHRDSAGEFELIDMNSMNGVYVNGEKIGRATIKEGDVIEIGDILLSFSLDAPEHEEEESTIMQKTKPPQSVD